MKRKKILYSWFASSSNRLLIVSQSIISPINFIIQPALIENINIIVFVFFWSLL